MPEMKISFLGTGSGSSTNRAHSVMVYDCDDGTRLLIDTSSGNSVARSASELGMSRRREWMRDSLRWPGRTRLGSVPPLTKCVEYRHALPRLQSPRL